VANGSGNKKNNNPQSSVLPINDFGQQCLNGITNWSAAKGGQVLPHFEHIVSGASMPPCPIVAVFSILCKRSWLVCQLLVDSPQIRVVGLQGFPPKG
jgi:hypothetical protein